ncbi:NAD(P)/FAD-dependent oxidoreductase [Daeguia caeni]|uniref:NAD(P)/FAD-dependent oxidoreductase n=1 Tax=Daeguia caeni TaxID=439612 RepID=A0ABV9H5Z2_9HYPH
MKTTPYWWEDAEPQHGERSFDKSDCSVLIIGAGYTGLSAAITLAEEGIGNIFVVDAMRIGEGASSRNGGQLGNSPKFDLAYAQRKFGDKRGREIIEDYDASVSFLIKRAQSLGADIDLNLNGSVAGAHSRQDFARLRQIRDRLPADKRTQFELIEEKDVHRVLKTDIYRGALLRHDWGSLHPAKYVKALADRARALGVRIFTGWRYGGADKSGSAYLARLSQTNDTGTVQIRADSVFIAVNGYAGPEFPWLRKRIIPVQSYMIATEELPFDMLEELIPQNRVVNDTKHILYYFRRSPDGKRILFGGRASFRKANEQESAVGLRAFMEHTFPSLRGVKLTHSWLGNVCFAYDFVTHAGRLPDGIYYSSCYNGNGVSMATYIGHRMAEMILNKPGHDRGVINTHFPRLYCYNGNPWFLPIVGSWYRFLDKKARWGEK